MNRRKSERLRGDVSCTRLEIAEPRLDCEAVERWLSREGERDSDPPVAVERHLHTCAECREELDSRALLPRSLAEMADESAEATVAADPFFVRGVMAQVRELPAPVRVSERRRLRWVRAAALLLVTATLFVVYQWGVFPDSLDEPLSGSLTESLSEANPSASQGASLLFDESVSPNRVFASYGSDSYSGGGGMEAEWDASGAEVSVEYCPPVRQEATPTRQEFRF